MISKIFQEVLDETPEHVDIFVRLYADLTVRINELLRKKGITKEELADRLDKSPSEISKWLSGEHNFTLRSLAKLSAELGEPLLEVPKRTAQPTEKEAVSEVELVAG
jgi:transcriptional regulator with XRE-family HTH domain